MSRTAVATIHLSALRANLARLRTLSQGAKVMAVVKADGYGHGLERVARALADADAFGVAAIADGQRLRAAGHTQRIVVLSGPDEAADLAELRRLRLDAVIHHDSQLAWLEADRDARRLRVWLKIDSGMHRLGFAPERTAEVLARLKAAPTVDDDVVLMTHFAASDEFDNDATARQIERFATGSNASPAHWPMRTPHKACRACAACPTRPACSAGPPRAATGCEPVVCSMACPLSPASAAAIWVSIRP